MDEVEDEDDEEDNEEEDVADPEIENFQNADFHKPIRYP